MRVMLFAGGRNIGPLDEKQLSRLIRGGGLGPDTPSWPEGGAGWVPLGTALPGLFAPPPAVRSRGRIALAIALALGVAGVWVGVWLWLLWPAPAARGPDVPETGLEPAAAPPANAQPAPELGDPAVLPDGPAATGLSGTLALGPPVEVVRRAIGAAGGEIAVAGAGGSLQGLRLAVPPQALAADATFVVRSREIGGHTFGDALMPASPLIEVDDGEAIADGLIRVRIPAAVPEGAFAMAFYYDEAGERLEGLPLLGRDTDGIDVVTRHFSSFFAAIVDLAKLPDVVNTRFRPGTDDWRFDNEGSFPEVDGHCAGQALTAMWYYVERRRRRAASPLSEVSDNNGGLGTAELWQDDSNGYRLCSVVQHHGWDRFAWGLFDGMKDPSLQGLQWDAFRVALWATGEPQLVVLWRPDGAVHAVVAFAYTRDRLWVADPNYSGEQRTIVWSSERGKFDGYSSGENAREISAAGASVFDRIAFVAKTAVFPWSSIGVRFAQFDAGTIGNDLFPGYALEVEVPGPEGTPIWKPLLPGFSTTEKTLTIRAAMDDSTLRWRLDAYRGAQHAVAGLEGKPIVVELLEEGENPFGFYLEAAQAGWPELEYVDFERLTIQRGRGWAFAERKVKVNGGTSAPGSPERNSSHSLEGGTITLQVHGSLYNDGELSAIYAFTEPPAELVPGDRWTVSIHGVFEADPPLRAVQCAPRMHQSWALCSQFRTGPGIPEQAFGKLSLGCGHPEAGVDGAATVPTMEQAPLGKISVVLRFVLESYTVDVEYVYRPAGE